MRITSVLINALGLWLGWTALAHADPITTALFGAAFAATFFGGVVSAAIGIAVSYGLSLLASALSPQPTQTDANVGVNGTIQVGGDSPLRFPLGPSADAGLLVYIGTWGNDGDTPNAYLSQVIAVSDLPVTGNPVLWVLDQKCTIDFGGTLTDQGYPVTEYPGKLWVRWHDGTQTTVDSLMAAKFASDPNYPYLDMIGRGTAYAVVTALWDRNTWNGVPTFLIETPSIPLYDIRLDTTAGGSGSHRWADPSTWAVSDNPIVQAYNVARGIYFGTEWVFGGQNWPAFRLPAASLMAAMNECDASAALAGGGSEKAYRTGGMVGTDSTPTAVISALLTSCSGRIAEVGGIYKVLVGANAAAVYSFTDSDIVVTEDQGYDPFPGLDSTANAVTATYTEPAEKWASKDAPPLYSPDLETADDDRRLPVNIDYPMVQFNTQVQRLMRDALADARRFRNHSHYLPPYAWLLEPLDTVDWSSDRNGYTAKQFLLSSIEGEPSFLQSVGLKEIDPSDFDRDPDTEQQSYSVGELVTNRPAPQLVAGWTAVPGTYLDDDGVARHPAIIITTSGLLADVRAVRVQVRLTSSGSLLFDGEVPYDPTISSPSWTVSFAGILPDTAYQIRGKFLPFSGRTTYWSNQDEDGTEGDWIDVTTPVVVSADVENVLISQLGSDTKDFLLWAGASVRALQTSIQQLSLQGWSQDFDNYNDHKELFRQITSTNGTLQASFTEAIVAATGPTSALVEDVTSLFVAMGGDSAGVNVRFSSSYTPAAGFDARFGLEAYDALGSAFESVGIFGEVSSVNGGRLVLVGSQIALSDDLGNIFALFNNDGEVINGVLRGPGTGNFWNLSGVTSTTGLGPGAFRVSNV